MLHRFIRHAARRVAVPLPRLSHRLSPILQTRCRWSYSSTAQATDLEDAPTASIEVDSSPPPKPSPGDSDLTRFEIDDSVAAWRGYGAKFASSLNRGSADASNFERMDFDDFVQKVRNSLVIKDAQSAAFWTYHMARLSFFVSQAAAGLVAHDLSERIRGDLPPGTKSSLQNVGSRGETELYTRSAEAVGSWRQDYAFIEQGMYKLPWDMTTLSHRQYNPLFALSRTLSFLNESVATLQRRMRNAPEDLWLKSDLYPSYYTKTYHYQTDGWMSSHSASVYEHSTETLFFGRQDAMQRTALVPISMWLSASGMAAGDVRLLELGAGTGRFHTFIKDNWPEMKTTCSELSPFYLSTARENLIYWKSMRQPNSSLGGPDNTGVELLQASAESLPSIPDASQHVVLSVYLFHELPEESRQKIVAEMFRVLKPGGLAVLTDSVQTGDRPEWDQSLANFENFNEPFYRNYVDCDHGAMFQNTGFVCGSKWLNSSTKTLSFFKPDPANN